MLCLIPMIPKLAGIVNIGALLETSWFGHECLQCRVTAIVGFVLRLCSKALGSDLTAVPLPTFPELWLCRKCGSQFPAVLLAACI